MGSGLEKRVKRHILSKTYRFLGVVQPAFRDTAKREMRGEGFSVVGEVEGGVEFEGGLEEGWRANLVLRTISRVYCRIDSFRAGAREELYRKARTIPWELWIDPIVPVRVEASAHRSRIHHEGMLRETLLEAIQDRWKEAGHPGVGRDGMKGGEVEGGDSQRVLIHSEGNRCTISLDMSGEGLYRRGYRSLPGEAPIREDLAASLLREWGWNGDGILCDPMTGSGTFSIEAIQMGLGIPPGGNRTFRFQTWPSFREPRWNFVKKQTRAKTRTANFPAPPEVCKLLCFASDWRAEAVSRARVNSRASGVEEYIHFEQKDFFSLNGEYVESRIQSVGMKPENSGNSGDRIYSRIGKNRFLVLNPPYGKRLGLERSYYHRLKEHIRKGFPHWKVLLLLPVSVDVSDLAGGSGFRRIVFRHGGLRIQALFFENN